MKTLQQFIDEVTDSVVHKCGAKCRPDNHVHVGGGYDSPDHFTPEMRRSILAQATHLYNNQPQE